MSIFNDARGQQWRIEFDGFLLDRIAKEADVDLADLSAGGLLEVDRDAKALIRVLAVACEDQLKEQRKTVADFQRQIRKDAITEAKAAVAEALADFFPASEWSAMQSNLTKRKNKPELTPEDMEIALRFTQMDPEVQRGVMAAIQAETGGLGNLQSSQENGFAVGQEDTQEMPAFVSQESAELAPGDTLSEASG